jgi:hypothetical protein
MPAQVKRKGGAAAAGGARASSRSRSAQATDDEIFAEGSSSAGGLSGLLGAGKENAVPQATPGKPSSSSTAASASTSAAAAALDALSPISPVDMDVVAGAPTLDARAFQQKLAAMRGLMAKASVEVAQKDALHARHTAALANNVKGA